MWIHKNGKHLYSYGVHNRDCVQTVSPRIMIYMFHVVKVSHRAIYNKDWKKPLEKSKVNAKHIYNSLLLIIMALWLYVRRHSPRTIPRHHGTHVRAACHLAINIWVSGHSSILQCKLLKKYQINARHIYN